jgi:hypothetical protein
LCCCGDDDDDDDSVEEAARVPAAEVEEIKAAVVRRRRFLRVGSAMVALWEAGWACAVGSSCLLTQKVVIIRWGVTDQSRVFTKREEGLM